MKATPKNMRKLALKEGEPIAARGVFAYCEVCGNETSASAGDYFMLDENTPLVCSGEEGSHKKTDMILATKTLSIIPLV